MAWQRPAHEIRAILAHEERVAVGYALHDLELVPTDDEDRVVGHLGPDLLDPAWDDAHAAEALRRFTARGEHELGLVLLEQRVMAGVGNLYKAEVCFLLGLSPWTPVRDVPDPARADLAVPRAAVRNKDRPEQSTTGELGRGRQHWVFERPNQRCFRCGTRIRVGEQGDGVYARVAYWCPRCQPGPMPSPLYGAAGPRDAADAARPTGCAARGGRSVGAGLLHLARGLGVGRDRGGRGLARGDLARDRSAAHRRADLLEPGCPAISHAGLLHLEHAALHRVLRQLGRPDGVGVAALDLVAHLVEGRGVARRGELAHRPQRRADLLLHLGLLELAEQLGALGDLLLQHHRVLLDGLLGLRRRPAAPGRAAP